MSTWGLLSTQMHRQSVVIKKKEGTPCGATMDGNRGTEFTLRRIIEISMAHSQSLGDAEKA